MRSATPGLVLPESALRRHQRFFPPGWWRPYPQGSIWKPVPPSPSLHADSAAIVSKLTTPGNATQMRPGEDSSAVVSGVTHPVYIADPHDPLFTVSQRSGGNASDWWGTQIRLPQKALPSDGLDAHMAVVYPDGTEWFIYDVASDAAGTALTALPEGGGTIYGTGFGKHSILDDGAKAGTGNATAAHFPSMYGAIRVEEMLARLVGHALFMTANWSNGKVVAPAAGPGRVRTTTLNGGHTFPTTPVTVASTSGFTTTGSFRLPNDSIVTYTGLNATQFTGCTGGTGTHSNGATVAEEYWPPVGARFWIDMTDAEIDAIADSSNSTGRWWNKVLLKAVARYGAFVGDTGGGNWGFQMIAGMEQYALTGTDPWRQWAASTSPAMTYFSTDDVYLWDYRTVIDWSAEFKVLDWNDPDNH